MKNNFIGDRIDWFGSTPTYFNFENRRKVHSNCGVFGSILSFCAIISYVALKVLNILDKQNKQEQIIYHIEVLDLIAGIGGFSIAVCFAINLIV